MAHIVRTQAEIDEQLSRAYAGLEKGTRYRAMPYEQGLIDFHDWLTGQTDDEPMEPEDTGPPVLLGGGPG